MNILFLFLMSFTNVNAAQDIPNLHQVNKNIYRGGRPSEKGLSELAAQGIKTDINLEDDNNAITKDKEVAERLGMKFFSFPLSGWKQPQDATVDGALAVLNDPANFPIYVHCQHGQDRTGMVVGLYRVFSEKWTPQTAYQEMLDLGFHRALFLLDGYYREKTGLNDLYLLTYR